MQCHFHPNAIHFAVHVASTGDTHRPKRLHEFMLTMRVMTAMHHGWIVVEVHSEVHLIVSQRICGTGQGVYCQRSSPLQIEGIRHPGLIPFPLDCRHIEFRYLLPDVPDGITGLPYLDTAVSLQTGRAVRLPCEYQVIRPPGELQGK